MYIVSVTLGCTSAEDCFAVMESSRASSSVPPGAPPAAAVEGPGCCWFSNVDGDSTAADADAAAATLLSCSTAGLPPVPPPPPPPAGPLPVRALLLFLPRPDDGLGLLPDEEPPPPEDVCCSCCCCGGGAGFSPAGAESEVPEDFSGATGVMDRNPKDSQGAPVFLDRAIFKGREILNS